MTKQKQQHALHFEAHPKAVKRALRATSLGLGVVECRASLRGPDVAENGNTTLIYTHDLDAGAHHDALQVLTKQTNIEQDHLLRDDPDEEEA